MKTTLGTFEGRKVEAAAIRLTGSAEERVGTLDLEEEIFLVAKATVVKVTHGDVKDIFIRLHTAKVTSMALIERSDGERMLEEGQALADERFGLQGLFQQAGNLTVNSDGEIISADPNEPDD